MIKFFVWGVSGTCNETISEAVSKLQFYGTNCSASSEKKRKFAYFLKKTKKTVKGKKINRGRISRGSQNLRGYGAISQFYGRNNSQIQDLYSKPLGEWTPLENMEKLGIISKIWNHMHEKNKNIDFFAFFVCLIHHADCLTSDFLFMLKELLVTIKQAKSYNL